ncbi:hypothetical protein [uncultured Sphingomonas sp.]|uniref:hypothetical protein n=1 Tax=uncultured Sphingomonas sp. TaxID=158754 RepID=UPI0025EFFD78|nr:hypothetical protein [uncultured Sphingomonas sp.]
MAFRGKGDAAPANRGVDDGAARTGVVRAIVGQCAVSHLPEPSVPVRLRVARHFHS